MDRAGLIFCIGALALSLAAAVVAYPLAAVPADGPSMALLKRIEAMQASPPPPDWDGTWPVAGG